MRADRGDRWRADQAADRQRAPEPRLRAHHLAHRRRDRHPPRRPGQHRPRRPTRTASSSSRSSIPSPSSSRCRRTISPRIAKELAAGRRSTVDAMSRDGATKLGTGKLALIDNQINQSHGDDPAQGRCSPTPSATLWPNQFVKTRLLLTTRKDALVVPGRRRPARAAGHVRLRRRTPTTRPQVRPVEVDVDRGRQRGHRRAGSRPGDEVVVDGQNQLRPGAKVGLAPATDAAGGGGAAGGKPARPAPRRASRRRRRRAAPAGSTATSRRRQ